MTVLATLKEGTVEHALAAALMRIEGKLDRLLTQTAPRPPSGDEKVFKDPKEKYWPGESYIGSKLSECPANYLRAYAKYKGACAFMARKENDPAKMKYADKDEATAKLATAWADYREANGDPAAGMPAQPSAASEPSGVEDDIPF